MTTGKTSDSHARTTLRRARTFALATATALALGALAPLPGASAAVDTGSITGVVTDGTTALAGIEVTVWRTGTYGPVRVDTVTTDATGAYRVDGIAAAVKHSVQFTDPTGERAMEFYDDAIVSPPYATWVQVTAGDVTPHIDAALEPGSTLSGTLTNEDGDPVDSGSVSLWWKVGTGYVRVADYEVAPDGHYTVPGVRGGHSYGLEFLDRTTGAEEAWDDATEVIRGTSIPVTSGVDVPGLDAVLGGTAVNTAPPTITGTPQVGVPLAATPGSWTPANTSVTYRWVVGDDTTPGDDPTGTTYVPTAQDVGRTIRVEATGTRGAGWTPVTAWSSATAPVAAASVPVVTPEPPVVVPPAPAPAPVVRVFTHDGRPAIKGVLRVGRTVRAAAVDVTPTPTALAYTWYADGKRIKKATKKRFTLTTKQLGKRITVVVTATGPSYEPLVVRSRKSVKVTP